MGLLKRQKTKKEVKREPTIGERLATIELTVTELKEHLMGNGQPGVLATLDGRLEKLENLRYIMFGIGIGIGIGTGVGAMKIIEAISR